jgi:hypothetical protein
MWPIFNMTPRKSHRVHKPRTIWEQNGAPYAAEDPKITKKTARTVEKTALKPLATRPLPKAVGFDANNEAFQLQTHTIGQSGSSKSSMGGIS